MFQRKGCAERRTRNGRGDISKMESTIARKRVKPRRAASDSGRPSDPDPRLNWQLLRASIWIDRGLQQNMQARGWPQFSRTESQILLLTAVGIVRPIEMARNLGLTRQAINQAIAQLIEKRVVKLEEDTRDKRCKIVTFVPEADPMRKDAREILQRLEAELERRSGRASLDCLREMAHWDWSNPPVF
ncbi:MAG: MarR family transcriptional regulator [Hyphomonas sp.]